MVSANDIVSGEVALAIVLVPLFVGYLLNQRQSRETFTREKSYERARDAFEQILKALGLLLRAVRVSRAQAQMYIALERVNADEKAKELMRHIWLTQTGLRELGGFEDTVRLETLLAVPKSKRDQEWSESVVITLALLSSHNWNRSQNAYNDALSAVALLGPNEEALKLAAEIYDKMDFSAGQVSEVLTKLIRGDDPDKVLLPDSPELWVAKKLEDLERVMRGRLEVILWRQATK